MREKLSLCYYCSARLFRQKGVMMVQSGVEFENAERAITEISKQLDAVRAGEFTHDDFDASVKSLADDYERLGGTPEELDDWYPSGCWKRPRPPRSRWQRKSARLRASRLWKRRKRSRSIRSIC